MPPNQELILILDFGAQYSQLIARRIREHSVYCEILPYHTSYQRINELNPAGIILSGGPASVYAQNAPHCAGEIFRSGIPILGICYGQQLGTLVLGGKVTPAPSREYGRTECRVIDKQGLFAGLPDRLIVWMSHGDRVSRISRQFSILARTPNSPCAAIRHKQLPFYGVQFHPEVTHTPSGSKIIRNFLYKICGCTGTWQMRSYITEAISRIKNEVGSRKVLCGLSGGVDSAVTAVLVHKAAGKQLTCVFVDNGLLRKDEAKKVQHTFRKHFSMNLVCVDATTRFLRRLKGVTDPETKRRVIGDEFIRVFTRTARKLGRFDYLAQGTLYPDVIESVSAWGGPTARIKSHHNVGGLPAKMPFKLIEPLRYLFKDEVRELGRQLGLPAELIKRQPFPGPGLAVRVLGAITTERLDILRAADEIITHEVEKAGLADKLWQYFAVLLPVNTVGVMGDERTYANALVIRTVESLDGMTADWAKLPYELVNHISSRITNEVKGVNRVVFDVTSKPPATIEWE
jgi:GMP synthase (glutamine-hydrolysing)